MSDWQTILKSRIWNRQKKHESYFKDLQQLGYKIDWDLLRCEWKITHPEYNGVVTYVDDLETAANWRFFCKLPEPKRFTWWDVYESLCKLQGYHYHFLKLNLYYKAEDKYLTYEGYPLGSTCWYVKVDFYGRIVNVAANTPMEAVYSALNFLIEGVEKTLKHFESGSKPFLSDDPDRFMELREELKKIDALKN